jgi:hypothetical protein
LVRALHFAAAREIAMRNVIWAAPLWLISCTQSAAEQVSPPPGSGSGGATGSTSATTTTAVTTGTTSTTATTGAGGQGGGGDPTKVELTLTETSNENATVDDALPTALTKPVELASGDAALVDITVDDRLVYNAKGSLWSVKARSGAPARMAAQKGGLTEVRGKTIFAFGDVDWKKNVGALTWWTPAVGRRGVGEAVIGDNHVDARDDAAYVVFGRNAQVDTFDVVVASADAKDAHVLLAGAPRGDTKTCGASFAFAGNDVIVSWCEAGSLNALLARFTLNGGAWQKTMIATGTQGGWSSDASGKRVFFVDTQSRGWVATGAQQQKIGQGVGWGRLTPAGDTLFFAVGDELRRSNMTVAPIPIVVEGFGQAVAFTADFGTLLYSSQVVYDAAGTAKQDLRVTTTHWFNPTPKTLVEQPIATLTRSALTSDGAFALYLTDIGAQGGTLHVRPLDGAVGVSIAKVDTALAASGGVVLLTDNRTSLYPVTADLKLYDAGAGAPVQLLEAGILDGRTIQLTADKHRLAYQPGAGGLWLRPIP